ncbi:hypothetical protein Tcan_08477 [Toxocara canis]|uniref:Uncharacterized protein n=1 Tax=Toxocara canis TaxID=6265 RepID=A0A0B2VW42_TOXCA|nr:hypothetical protein Tcan_08477 [Toxocara canis]
MPLNHKAYFGSSMTAHHSGFEDERRRNETHRRADDGSNMRNRGGGDKCLPLSQEAPLNQFVSGDQQFQTTKNACLKVTTVRALVAPVFIRVHFTKCQKIIKPEL